MGREKLALTVCARYWAPGLLKGSASGSWKRENGYDGPRGELIGWLLAE